MGRLTTLTPPAGPSLNVGLGYDPAGRLSSIAYPNGVTTAYGYDAKGRLASLSHTQGTNPSFASFGYTYNPVGNILQILDQVNPAETRSHTYDALQRLKTGGTTGTSESYNYDLVGNRTTSFLSSTHNHDDLNRLLEDEQFTYTYDNNGNLITKTSKANPTAVTTYHWDAQDQIIQIDLPNSTTVTYKYDGLGRRIEKNIAGTITRYVYDGEDILLEYDGTNTFLARYSHGDQVDQPLMLQKAGVGFFYYHSNHQGSITHLTNSSGTVANSYLYDSYGRRLSVAESVIQPYSYTGREYDGESGLYFYRARYFDAFTGRFLSEDPIGFDGGDSNLFNYLFNNPVNFEDPFGLRGGGGKGGGRQSGRGKGRDGLGEARDASDPYRGIPDDSIFEEAQEGFKDGLEQAFINDFVKPGFPPATDSSFKGRGNDLGRNIYKDLKDGLDDLKEFFENSPDLTVCPRGGICDAPPRPKCQ